MAKEYGISLGRILKEEGRRRDFNQTKFSRWPFPTMDIDLCSMGSSGDRVLGLVRGARWISMEFDKLVLCTVPKIYFG